MRRGVHLVLPLLFLCGALLGVPATPAVASGDWAWPVSGPVIRAFDPPDSPYGTGHRGIDIAAPVGSGLVAPADGTVSFAGPVGGRLFLTIDHGNGLQSTYSWLSRLLVHKGDRVRRGEPVALTEWGHPDAPVPHLHLGVKLDGTYVDPMSYLGPVSVGAFVRLAPL